MSKGHIQKSIAILCSISKLFMDNLVMLLQKIVATILRILIKTQVDEDGDIKQNQKHFDFKLNGSLNGSEYDKSN